MTIAMPRRNRNMLRQSFFADAAHVAIVEKLAARKGVTLSDVYRAMLRKHLQGEIKEIQEKK